MAQQEYGTIVQEAKIVGYVSMQLPVRPHSSKLSPSVRREGRAEIQPGNVE